MKQMAPTDESRESKVPAAKGRRGYLESRWWPLILIAPAVLFEVVINLIPLVAGVWSSFVKLTKFFIANWSEAPFYGLNNYRIAVDFNGAAGAGLLQSFFLTCAFTILVVGLSWLLGMAAAVALQKAFRGRAIFRTIFLIPYAIPVYAGIIAWKFIFQRDTGALNHLLFDVLGASGDRPFWLIGNNAFAALVVVALWRLWPFAFLMLMAGMQSIPQELYEASVVDGAKPFRQWLSITLPMLRPVNLVLMLVMFLWVFNDFTSPFVLFGSAQPPAGDLISLHIYNASFLTWNFGLGSAMSVMLMLFLLLVSGVYLRVTNTSSQRA